MITITDRHTGAVIRSLDAETRRQQVAQGTSERVLNADGSVKYEYPELTDKERASGRFPLAGMEIGNVD